MRRISATGGVRIVAGGFALALALCAPLQAQGPDLPPADRVIETAPVGILSRLDSVFQSIVTRLGGVLFYELGGHSRQVVVYEPHTTYVRDRGSSGPFVAYPQTSESESISNDDLGRLAARGLLEPGHIIDDQPRTYRWGLLGERAVEYLSVREKGSADGLAQFGDRYLMEPDGETFRKLNAEGQPTDDLPVPRSIVEQWGAAGDLASAGDPGDGPPWLITERVGGLPLIVAWLLAGALFFTLYLKFFNLRGFRHAIEVVRGRYDNPTETGEVTHFQALSSALSGTVGLGNIAGVTIAMTLGGPGAFFWMLVSGLLGMSSKFAECTLGLKYRTVQPDGTVLGGPMRYLNVGLRELGLAPLGIFLSLLFSCMCILGSFGGGNMLQANQAGSATLHMLQHEDLYRLQQLKGEMRKVAEANDQAALAGLQDQHDQLAAKIARVEAWFKPTYGAILALLVAVVIIGGIRRIGSATSKLVPSMCLIYTAACLFIILRHVDRIPEVIGQVLSEAWTGRAAAGGLVGVLVVGIKRAAFSNEAGAGSAAIAHAAARTEEPVREGCVALLEPFVDTVVICSMTALVILLTGAWNNTRWIVDQGLEGAALTSRAFQEEIPWFPLVLSVAVTLFAYSTIISWSYYGERAWAYLLGVRSVPVYRTLAVICVFIGTVVNLGSVLDFSDMMILGMAFPNILGVAILAPQLKRDLADYWARYKAGDFPTYR